MKLCIIILFIVSFLLLAGCIEISNKTDPVTPIITMTINNHYSKEGVILYFNEITSGFEDGNLPEVVYKYPNDTVKIQVIGYADNQTFHQVYEDINSTISDFNGISEHTKLILVDDNNPNIWICIVAKSDFPKCITNYNKPDDGYFVTVPSKPGQLIKGIIVIINSPSTNEMDWDRYRNHVIREEITQSLGFGKDSREESPYKDSIFYHHNGSWTTGYSKIDKYLIRMLYNTDVPFNATKVEVESYFNSNPEIMREVLS